MTRTPLCALTIAALAFGTTHAFAQSSAPPGATLTLPASRYPAETRRLPNGLRVVISPQHDTARIAVWVTYAVGYRDDPADYHGLAHMLEHMMFQRTAHLREDQFAELLEHAGATDINATTSSDSTDYHEVLPAEQLPLALWLESERMAFLLDTLDTAELNAQRRVVLNESALRVGPNALAAAALDRALYPVGHPYRDTWEDPSDVRAIAVNDVAWFFEQYYAPHAATLIITGDVDPAATMALVERDFGSLRDRPGASRSVTAPRVRTPSRHVVTVEAPRTYTSVRIAWRTPRFFAPGDADMDVLGSMLTTDDSSLRGVLLRNGWVSSFEAQQDSRDLASEFTIDADITYGTDRNMVIGEIERQLDAMRAGHFDAAIFDDARWSWINYVRDREADVLTRARALASYARRFPDDADAFERDAQRYANVTTASLQHAATVLSDRHRVIEWMEAVQRAPTNGRVVGGDDTNGADEPL